jgi:hypothetical protein
MRHALLLAIAVLAACCFALPAPVHAAGEPRSLVGVNTDRLVNYSPACPTIDAIKTSQRFGSVRNPGDGKVALDADGWPIEDFSVLVHADVPGVAGVYKLSCDGKADVSGFWGRTTVANVKYDGKQTTADVHYRGGGAMAITFSNTSGGVRDIKLLRPGYDSDAAVFTDHYLASKAPFGAVRLMNWTLTNDSKVSRWDDRCKPTDAQWSIKGGPWEPWLDYAAKYHKDLWLNVPHLADDEYVRNLAQLCKERLGDAPVHLYLEHTNEYWNWQFKQAKWVDAEAKKRADEWQLNEPATSPGNLRHRYHAKRTLDIARIFREVFGEQDARIRPVLTGQLANPGATEDAVAWIERNHGPAKQFIYGVAPAQYFGNWAEKINRVDLTPQDLAEHLVKAAQHPAKAESKTGAAQRRFHDLAKKNGIRSMAYEGGVDLGHPPGKMSKEVLARFLAARTAAQFLPEAGEAVAAHLDWWFSTGGDEYFYYKDFSIYNKSGFFGLSNDPTKIDTPKYQAAIEAAKRYTTGAEADAGAE